MPNQYVNKVVKSDGTTLIDLTSDTVTSSDHIMSGYVGHLANGSQVTGTGQGGPSATAHTIYFEFSDGTDTTLTGYWDSSFISDAIRATTPSTYSGKTVALAQFDGVTWYEVADIDIPLNTELFDEDELTNTSYLDVDGNVQSGDWYLGVSGYMPVHPDAVFTAVGVRTSSSQKYIYHAFYDANKTFISTLRTTVSVDGSETKVFDSSNIPSNARYVRLTMDSAWVSGNQSFIRTA